MGLGRQLRELAGLRVSALVCLLLAVLAALTVAYEVRLVPPELRSRTQEIASARTEVLVDTPLSSVLDLRQGASELTQMTNRAVLIGNVMVTPPVLARIARRAGVPAALIRAQAPLTPDFPRPLSGTGHDPGTTDLLRSADQYRLNIQSNPSVPMLQIFAQAPSPRIAARLADAAVDGLRDHLAAAARAQGTPAGRVVRITQLGRAEGAVVTQGARAQLAALSFLIVFALSASFAIFLARVRRGWVEGGEDADGRPYDRSPPEYA